MPARSIGECTTCGGKYGRTEVSRHVAGCGGSARNGKPAFLIAVEGRRNRDYWLYLAVPQTATLGRLDSFLRDIWLECCGHMSQFRIGPTTYSPQPMREYGDRSSAIAVSKVLAVGNVFQHEYDMGSTTELKLKVVGVLEDGGSTQIRLLARNLPPAIPCCYCNSGAPATYICQECSQTEELGGWICAACVPEHECGEGMLPPVVNSPRVGICGYAG